MDVIKQIISFPFWNFISVIVIAWITHRFILSRDQGGRIREKQQEIYLSLLPIIAEYYALALEGAPNEKLLREFEVKMIEIEGKFQIMGTVETIDKLFDFSDIVRAALQDGISANNEKIHNAYVALNYAMCCHIHNEKHKHRR